MKQESRLISQIIPLDRSIPFPMSTAAQPEQLSISREQADALMVMINAIHLAAAKGSFNIFEASDVAAAVRRFVVPDPKQSQPGLGGFSQQTPPAPAQPDFNSLKMNIEQ